MSECMSVFLVLGMLDWCFGVVWLVGLSTVHGIGGSMDATHLREAIIVRIISVV